MVRTAKAKAAKGAKSKHSKRNGPVVKLVRSQGAAVGVGSRMTTRKSRYNSMKERTTEMERKCTILEGEKVAHSVKNVYDCESKRLLRRGLSRANRVFQPSVRTLVHGDDHQATYTIRLQKGLRTRSQREGGKRNGGTKEMREK
uniref:Uncharacterized protein n=1 Tax=Chromera velia CCMP2878 TaxID=1169474 RepID=A0A0G4FSW2_9ALVE|eukprot:Cvel_18455.t1-p1 / transcript=Cvel_18455.t1 / gene=Cvel_18455 / organism=Chromera_velia_CCMP2878 / gene_product=hypothetical protein / transcript_product=hypothetical protein / location=Cvel_scaffold1529:6683-8461(+) / protein_length=143 / sequence_SO=supercontig / SO=protein_coding / is_pseudo=false